MCSKWFQYYSNFTLYFDGKEISFPKNFFEDYINVNERWDYSFGFDFFYLFNATEIDYDNNIIVFYSFKYKEKIGI